MIISFVAECHQLIAIQHSAASSDIMDIDDSFNFFADISLATPTATQDELDAYFALPLEQTRHPLRWWWNKLKDFPILSQMALDFHNVPCKLSSYCISVV